MLVSQIWLVQVQKPITEYRLWVCPYFSNSVLDVLFISLEWGGCTAAVLCFQDLVKTVFLCSSHLVFFSICFVSIHVVHPYNRMDTAIAWKKSCFILLDRLDFYMIDSLSIVFHGFAKHMLTSLSVNEILLLWYVNRSTNLRGLPL